MITVTVVGDREVAARLAKMPVEVQRRIAVRMARVITRLQSYVKASKLSGQVLKNRTGALRRSVAQQLAQEPGRVTGRVGLFGGPTLHYGRAHEFGFSGTVAVKAHARRITKAFGRPIPPRDVLVRAHSLRLHLPERSFLRSALADLRPEITAALREAVGEAVRA